MKGCRPLSNDELKKALKSFEDINRIRKKTYFALGCNTAYKCSGILPLHVKDVCQYGCVIETFTIQHKNTKSKKKIRRKILRG
ncbi:MAG: hypothetical protein ACMUIU_10810 [bacterium]